MKKRPNYYIDYTSNYIDFNNLKKIREDNGFTLKEVKLNTDIPMSRLSEIENGKVSNVYIETLIKLSNFYRVSIYDLIKPNQEKKHNFKGKNKMDNKEFITQNIIKLRTSAKWSQAKLARKANVSGAAINKIEKGGRLPSLKMLRKLSDVFNVSLSELTGDPIRLSNDDEAKIFFIRFSELKNLTDADQLIILSLIKRLRENDKKG